MFCSQCGAKNNDTDRFCNSCGSPLAKAAAPKASAPPAYQAPDQQYYAQPASGIADESSRRLYAALAYFFGFLGGIVVLLTQKSDNLLRFHAWQSIVTSVVIGGLYIVLGILNTIIALITGNALFSFVMGLLGFATFILFVVLVVKAYQLERFKLPVIGEFAAKQANK